MAVIAFKKDKITPVNITGAKNEKGNWCPAFREEDAAIPCDAVASGEAATITLEDGTEAHYSYTVYLAADCPEFTLGQRVKLERANGETRETEVLGFHRYQHQAKLWL